MNKKSQMIEKTESQDRQQLPKAQGRRPLRLTRETLRTLSDRDLGQAAGGTSFFMCWPTRHSCTI